MLDAMDREMVSDVLGRQLLRSSTSVGANYRAACRGRSRAEFIAKIGTVLEEADECEYWLELLVGSGRINAEKAKNLVQEASELTAIFAATLITSKSPRRIQSEI